VSDGPLPPVFLRRLGTDEHTPPPLDEAQRRAARRVVARGEKDAARVGQPLGDYWSGRLGTAAGLRALNDEAGQIFFEVPLEATLDRAAADAVFDGIDAVIDVHTHFMADRQHLRGQADYQLNSYRHMMPDWWSGLDGMTFYSFAEYLRCLFLESETSVAVLTSPPPDGAGVPFLTNEELAGTRALIDRLAGSGRLLNHMVVHPTDPESLERLQSWRDAFAPSAWKVYTTGRMATADRPETWVPGTDWMLDDERTGLPFLELTRQLGIKRVCAHKGLSVQVDCGSPRDIGPAARMFPDLLFGVYHSGYEGVPPEGPYTPKTAHQGANRLITTLLENGLGPGSNVYADLGTTWFSVIKRPLEAAHLIGKLLLYVGEDNILWGTDATWYGPTQPVIDALRAFQIPDELCRRHGYPKLTDEIRAKILGRNAARFYDIDLAVARHAAMTDDLAWTRAALAEGIGIKP
jgi:predicted TIM-barrel fold metal-dependent hydrolase